MNNSGASGSGGVTSATGGTGGSSGSAGSGATAQCQAVSASTSSSMISRKFEPVLFSEEGDPSNTPSCSEIVNPERGIFSFYNLRNLDSLNALRAEGYTLIYGQILIDDYRNKDIDQALLDTLNVSFSKIRQAGIKVLPRFYYAAGANGADAPLTRVLSHIEQLTPFLQANSDVIAAMHGGFVGAWGEWHSSSNDLTAPESIKAIFDGLLTALPSSRMILARRPSHKEIAYGGPLTVDTAYAETELARVGHLNDCFLASDNDMGTYELTGEKTYAIADSAFTAVGGETCAVNAPRSECASAMAEMALHHWSFLNTSYHPEVLASWQSASCYEAIRCRLGYRLALLGHESPEAVRKGESFNFSLSLINDGYARPYNPRSVYLVLDGPEKRMLALNTDPRRWAPGVRIDECFAITLPTDLPSGSYQLGLALPDPESSLKEDERYAIQFSNGVVWSGGVNQLDAKLELID